MQNPASLANLRPGQGRPKGIPNKLTSDLREAIRLAAESGEPEGLIGYYKGLKRDRPEKFADAMRALIPRDLTIDATVTATHAALCEAAGAVAPEVVRAGIEAMRLKMSESAEVTHRKPAP